MSSCAASFRSSVGFAVFVVVVAVFTIIPELPMMLEDGVGIPAENVQFWTSALMSGYGGAFLLTPIFLGAYMDRTKSKQTPFLVGLIVMAAATILFYLSTHIALLMAGRALQGASGAFVWTSGMNYLNSRVGSTAVATGMGWIMVGASAGEVIGPITGGLLYEYAGHYSVFAVAVAIILVDIILRLLLVSESPRPESSSSSTVTQVEDEPLLESNGAGSGNNSYGSANQHKKLIQLCDEDCTPENDGSYERPPEVASKIPATKQKPGPGRSTLRSLLSNSNFLCSLWAIFVLSTSRTALETTLPLYLKSNFNWSSSGSGLVLLGLVSPNLFAPVTGPIINRFGPRWLSSISFWVIGPLYIALGLTTEHSLVGKVVFCCLVFCIGVCISVSTTAQMASVSVAAEEISASIERESGELVEASGRAYALMSMAFAGGMLCGPVWGGQVKEAFGWLAMCISFSTAGTISGCFTALSWRQWGMAPE